MTEHRHDIKNFSGRFLGVDASLTSTGLAVLDINKMVTWTLCPPKDMRGVERLQWFDHEVVKVLREHEPTDIILEGYAYNRPNQAHQIGELGGVLRLLFGRYCAPVYVMPPSSLKKFVTGSGKGTKAPMPLHLYKRWGLTIEQEDEADAAGLALALLHVKYLGLPLTNSQRDSLEKVNAVVRGVRRRSRCGKIKKLQQVATI